MGIFDDIYDKDDVSDPIPNHGEINGDAEKNEITEPGRGFLDDIIDETVKQMGGSSPKNDGWKDTGSDEKDKIWDTGEGWSTGETEDVWRSK